MDENWVQLEYDPDIIDAEVYEWIELLDDVIFFDNSLIDEKIILKTQWRPKKNVHVTSFLDAEISLDVLRIYCEGLKVPTRHDFSWSIFTSDSSSQVINSKYKLINW